jgi:cysteine desulfurase
MKYIYMDHASATSLHPEVLHAMMPHLRGVFGNPSSMHFYGREARIAVEDARMKVAQLLGVKRSTILFTSGGTESNNTGIYNAITDLGCRHMITSTVEHHAVLHPLQHWQRCSDVTASYVTVKENGEVDYDDLERQLYACTKAKVKCLVTLMGANNETGALLDIGLVGTICRKHEVVFHSDAIQTLGHYPLNLTDTPIQLLSAAAHKFGGPKGIGMLYVQEGLSVTPYLRGGSQEGGRRAGTENVAGIVGFAKALEIAMRDYEKNRSYIRNLKEYLAARLRNEIPGISFNGCPKEGLYTVLSVNFPRNENTETLVLQLDRKGICVSGGAACSSKGASHVMKALGKDKDFVTVRFSFSANNNLDEIERVVQVIKMLQDTTSRFVII